MALYSRDDYNKELSQPRVEVLSKSQVLQKSKTLDAPTEQRKDLQLQQRKGKPENYNITAEDPLAVTKRKEDYTKQIESMRQSFARRTQQLPQINDPVKKFIDELPDNDGNNLFKSHKNLKEQRRQRDEEHLTIKERDIVAEMKKDHVKFMTPSDKGKFTLSKLKQYRKDEMKIANEEQMTKYITQHKPQFQDNPDVPFYEVDQSMHYAKEPKMLGASQQLIEQKLRWKHDANLDKVGEGQGTILLKDVKKQREETIQKNWDLLDPAKNENEKTVPKFARRTKFTTEIMAEKNPDWAFLKVKGSMDTDEDKPMYSCFSPDGYFREQMLPQLRVQTEEAREIPRELRGMVRVMQLPITVHEPQILNMDFSKLPGETRIMTRPEFF